MDASKEKEHLLALKVMRLTRPALQSNWSLVGNLHRTDDYSLPGFALSPILTLPQNFGNIFLGETFSSYISVRNESKETVTDVAIKTDLQTSSQRLSLSGTMTLPSLDDHVLPCQSVDDVIHHEAKELGTHILVCAVTYSNLQGEKFAFRKFFKFQVMKPLDVKTKFYTTENDEIFLEAQIQNLTPSVIYMEKVHLDSTHHYTATDLNFYEDRKRVHGDLLLMESMSVLQFLYRLRPTSSASSGHSQQLMAVGKLDIVWRSRLGEKGRLQTSPLHRPAIVTNDLHISAQRLPEFVNLHEVFELELKVTNNSERSVQLKLGLLNESSAALKWLGVSGRELGKLGPTCSLSITLRVLPIKPGLQKIEGVLLTDTFLNRVYRYEEEAKVYVLSKPSQTVSEHFSNLKISSCS